MAAKDVIFSMKQGMDQFVMTLYYKLAQEMPAQEAANHTLGVIEKVRHLFIATTEYDWKDAAKNALNDGLAVITTLYENEESEEIKFQLRAKYDKIEAVKKQIDELS